MKKLVVFVFIIFSVAISYITGAEKEDKIMVAILPFFSEVKVISKTLINTASEKFINQIIDIGKYTVVERAKLELALKELKLQQGYAFNEETASKIGKLAGAQMVMYGGINESSKYYCYLWARMVNVETGDIVTAKEINVSDSDDIDNAVEKLANLISGKKVVIEKDNLEEIKSKNNQFIKRIKFESSEKNFIEKYYNGKWGFSLDDEVRSISKKQQSIVTGAVLAATGSTILLSGMISMIVMFNYYTTNSVYEWEGDLQYIVSKNKYPLYNLAPILGGVLMPVGAILSVFSAIPFWFAYMINAIYKKATDGKKLIFFDRVNLNIGFVMVDNIFDKYDKYENRLNINITISL